MQTEIVVSGFGGQGVLFAGQVLAYTALDAGMQVTWYPSYGPEMRGGTANCMVIVADEEIGAPLVQNPSAAIVMNRPSLDKYEALLKSDGVLVINTSLIEQPVRRRDLNTVAVPATRIAEDLGKVRLANMVLVGALLARLPLFDLDLVKAAMAEHLPDRRKNLLALNFAALDRGAAVASIEVPVYA